MKGRGFGIRFNDERADRLTEEFPPEQSSQDRFPNLVLLFNLEFAFAQMVCEQR